MSLNKVLIAICIIIIPDLGIMLRKPKPKEGGAIGPLTPLLQMSGIPLICHLGKPPLYPVLNETLPK